MKNANSTGTDGTAGGRRRIKEGQEDLEEVVEEMRNDLRIRE